MRTAIVAGLLAILSASVACGARTELPGLRGADGPSGGGGEGGDRLVGPLATSVGGGGSHEGGGGNDGGGGQNEGGAPPFEPCDPDVLFIYLVTSETDLYRFDPSAPAGQRFERVGALSCPTQLGGTPFSMAVSRSGRAYSVYTTGELFRINVKDASCSATSWWPSPADFAVFGMGYALDDDGGGETLYVADIQFGQPSAGLGIIDTEDFSFAYIGPFSENPGDAIELTSADDGELYGYFLNDGGGGTVVRIDKDSGVILEAAALDVGTGGSLAFAYWGGDFYIFNGQGTTSLVWRYSPSTGVVEQFDQLDREIVGAGVTTCDPDQAG